MANGLDTMHPVAAASLKALGVQDYQVTQSWGTAVVASAGFHDPESTIDGHNYSSCVDLKWELASPAFKARLVEAGFAPFFRHTGSFANNCHIHAVSIGLKDDQGRCRILSGPREQLIDAYQNLDGLVGHDPIESTYEFTKDERTLMYQNYSEWVPDVATKVLAPEGHQIPCYAFLEQDAVRVDLRPFAEYWGATVSWDSRANHAVVTMNGKAIDLSHADMRVEGGEFTRCQIRPLAEGLGLKVKSFTWANDHAAATVNLAY